MKLEIENYLPDSIKLTTGNPESVNFDSDKSHVIIRFAVKSMQSDLHAELKKQYQKDVETCKSIEGLEACQLWQYKYKNSEWFICPDDLQWVNEQYRRHPHADSIIEYHKCSDTNKKRWQYSENGCEIWQDNGNGEPSWFELSKYRLKPRTITIVVNGESKEYNAPLNVVPVVGDEYWMIELNYNGYQAESTRWLDDANDRKALKNNLVFATQEDCQAVADAFSEILAGTE